MRNRIRRQVPARPAMNAMTLTRRALAVAAVVVAWLVLAPAAEADDQLRWSDAVHMEPNETAIE